MKICVISTTILPVPLAGYGGLEQIAYLCAQGLSRKGHEVLLIAPGDSKPPAGVELHRTTVGESEQAAYSGYWQRLPGYDAIIDHSWNKWSYILKIEGKLKAPILGVCHAPIHTMYGSAPPVLRPCLVAISDDQAVAISEHLGIVARACHNGIDLDFYRAKPSITRTERYLFLARMSRVKGPHLAVDLAKRLRFNLDLVGDDALTGEPELAQRLRSESRHNITYHGGVSRERSVEFFSSGKALLHMNQIFREPLGLAPLEAQACGMPVIAFDNGAMRETVRHGESGFVCKTLSEVEDLIRADATREIRADACRASAERFSIKKMTDRYESLCVEAVEGGGW